MKLRGMKNQVWVTSAVTDDEAKKSIVLVNSLKRVLSNRSVVVLASGKVAPNLRLVANFTLPENCMAHHAYYLRKK
ncbi:unnamed protein product [Orchesella dallaii]|uniref:Uncharacterized protein n=1 Tax=Orchesella dallaii TaxID=48710 RepID=A0ABP1R943_9HEXA